MTGLDFYHNQTNLTVRLGKLEPQDLSADCIIGLSLGALVVLKNLDKISGQVILINPLLPKRNQAIWFFRWLKYIFGEGLFLERQYFTKNPLKFGWAMASCIKLLSTDFEPTITNFSKDSLIAIRGKADKYFCDDEAAEFLKSKSIKVIETDGAHNWSEGIEETLANIVKAKQNPAL